MLLALLPFVAWGAVVKVTPFNVTKYYGQQDPTGAGLIFDTEAPAGWDEAIGGLTQARKEAILRAGLQISRNGKNAGEALGDYTYTLQFRASNANAKAVQTAEEPDEFTTAHVTTFMENYSVGINGTSILSIERMPLSDELLIYVKPISAQIYSQDHNAEPLPEQVKNLANNAVLQNNEDYTVTWASNTAPTGGNKTAQAIITGIGNYTGSTTVLFAINANMASVTLDVEGVNDKTYDGTPTNPAYDLTMGTTALFENTDYTVSYSNTNVTFINPANPTDAEIEKALTHAGTVTLTFTGIDDAGYTGTQTYQYTIAPMTVTAEAVTYDLDEEAPIYSGSPLKPVFSWVKAGAANEVVPETDYVISNEGTDAGNNTASLTFNAKSNFTLGNGVKTVTYTIAQKALVWEGDENLVVASFLGQEAGTEPDHWTWTNAYIQPTVRLLDGSTIIDATKNYSVEYKDVVNEAPADLTTNVGAKYAVITAKATGNYTFDAKNLPYTIDQKALTIKVKDFAVGYATEIKPDLEFTGYIAETPDKTKADIITAATFAYTDANEGEVDDIDAAAPNDPENPYYTVTISNQDALRVLAETNAANYAITFETGRLIKNAGQVTVQINNNTAEYGDNFADVDGWTVSYVDGLTDAEKVVTAKFDYESDEFDPANSEPVTTMDQIVKEVYTNPDFALVTPVALLDVNPEGYAVKYGTGVISNPNYVVTAQNGKLIVGKKHIRAINIQLEDGNTIKYNGSVASRHVDVSPSADFTHGHDAGNDYLPTNYYETVFDENVNAGENRVARLSMKGLGTEKYVAETPVPYTDEDFEAYVEAHGEEPSWAVGEIKEILPYVEVEYTIHPLKITITANDFIGDAAWTYGSPEAADRYNARVSDTEENSGDALVEADKLAALIAGDQPEGFNGKLVVKRVGANGVGTWPEGLKAMIVDAEGNELSPEAFNANNAAANYDIAFEYGKLEVVPGTITVKVKDVQIPYGENPENLYLEAIKGMENDPADFETIVTYSHDPADFGYDAEDMKDIMSYTLTYKSTADAPTAQNYNIVFADDPTGTLEVTKRPVKIEIADDAIEYNGLAAWKEALAAANEAKNFGDYLAVAPAAEGFYDLTDENLLSDVLASVNLETENVGANVISATAATTGAALHYAFTFVNGTLTIGSEGVNTIVLNRVAKASYDDEHANTAAKVIAANNGKFVNVKFSDFSMIAEKWYPLVLPFATSVREISKVFGYAVVDVFNGTTANGDIKFKLHMGDIEANTPFIVKVYEDQNMSDVSKYYVEAGAEHVKFANVKLVNAMDDNKEVKVNEGSDVDFVGTYLGRIDGFRSNMYYFSAEADKNDYYQGSDANTTYLRPLGAYFFDNSADAGSKSRGIIIEEADGSTTAISAITVDGAFVEADGWYTTNGVKLQGVPTEKGVYIRNGKKIVIK